MADGFHGYYRYTDVIFEWPKHVEDDQVEPLKAMLNADSLTDEGCPLREDGQDGIELYIGEWPGGTKRFLFSSKQIEYIRYYLYQTGMVDTAISIPSFQYLIQPSEMVHLEPHTYNDTTALRRVLKDLDKHNKRVKKGTPATRLTDVQRELEEIRGRVETAKAGGGGVFLAIDFESWEKDHSIVTEWGYAGCRWVPNHDGTGALEQINEEAHLIAEDYRNYRNGYYVPDHKDYYRFGESKRIKTVPLFRKALKDLIDRWSSFAANEGGSPLYLIFHDTSSDFKYLSECGVDVATIRVNILSPSHLPADANSEVSSDQRIFALDTKGMYESVVKTAGTKTEKRSLEAMLDDLGFDAERLHNAGNDAHWTLEGFLKMAAHGKGAKVDLLFKD